MVTLEVNDVCELQLRKNSDSLDLNSVGDTAPIQTIQLVPDASVEYSVIAPKFNDCRVLALLFVVPVRVWYIGLFGEYLPPTKVPIGVMYESAPQPSDHRYKSDAMHRSHVNY